MLIFNSIYLLSIYYTDNQLSSVQRQLNLYGFKCINRGEDKGAFFHPQFKRGDWEIVKRITRYVPRKSNAGEGTGSGSASGNASASNEAEAELTAISSGGKASGKSPVPSTTSATTDAPLTFQPVRTGGHHPYAYHHPQAGFHPNFAPGHPAAGHKPADYWHQWNLHRHHYHHMPIPPSHLAMHAAPAPRPIDFPAPYGHVADYSSLAMTTVAPPLKKSPSNGKSLDHGHGMFTNHHDVVMIDTTACSDFDDDFSLFHDDHDMEMPMGSSAQTLVNAQQPMKIASVPVPMPVTSTPAPPTKPKMVDACVNTDLTQNGIHSFYELYRVSHPMYFDHNKTMHATK